MTFIKHLLHVNNCLLSVDIMLNQKRHLPCCHGTYGLIYKKVIHKYCLLVSQTLQISNKLSYSRVRESESQLFRILRWKIVKSWDRKHLPGKMLLLHQYPQQSSSLKLCVDSNQHNVAFYTGTINCFKDTQDLSFFATFDVFHLILLP